MYHHTHHHGLFAALLFAMIPGSSAIMITLFAFILMGWLGIIIPAILAVLLCFLAHIKHEPAPAPHAHRHH